MARPTAKQTAARERNWGIRQLRAVWHLVGHLREPWKSQARALIDADIVDRGAESEKIRQDRHRAELESEIPF